MSSSLNTFWLKASAKISFWIGFGSESGSFKALSIVISLILASSSAEMSFLETYCGFIAAICIAIVLIAAVTVSFSGASASTNTPIFPPA